MATTSQELLVRIDALIAQHDSFPQRLDDARQNQEHYKSILRLLQPKISDRENETELAVAGQLKEDNKPAFTNETSRKAEVKRRLFNDAEYQGMLKEQESLNVSISNAGRIIGRIEDERRSVEKQSDLLMKSADIIITKATLDYKLKTLKGDA